MRPWECQVKIKFDYLTKMNQILYSYSKNMNSDFIYEKEPSRVLKILSPESYKGELGSQKSSQWRQMDKVHIVNGHIEKADGNFLGESFYQKIGETSISIGSHPSTEEEILRLKQNGISGVLCLMTANDFK